MDRYIPPRDVSREAFPESEKSCPGMQILPADFTPRTCRAILQVPYAKKSGRTLHLHLIVPEQKEGEEGKMFPLLLFIQGSAWRQQDLGLNLCNLPQMARRGFVVALIEYRPSDIAPFPAQICDAKTALRFLLRHQEEYSFDPRRVFLWGDSSGGHTAVMTALTAHDPRLLDEDGDTQPLHICGCIDYYGPVLISTMNHEPSTQDHVGAGSPEGMLLGGVRVDEHEKEAFLASPLAYLQKGKAPPMLIVHGSRDRLVPFGQSCLLFDALQENGCDAAFYQLQGADHGGAPFFSPAVLQIVENFLRAHGT